MNEIGVSEEEIFTLLDNAKKKDFRYQRVLSSMCTYPHEIAVKAHMQFIESNMGDFGLFRGTHEMEKEIILMLGEIYGCSSVEGYLTTGGTESNIQAVRAMRNFSRDKGSYDSSKVRPNIVVPASAHFSFDKISDILDVDVRKADLDNDMKVSVPSMESLIDENTVGLVAIAGSTEFGQVDPIVEISELAISRSLPLHIDAAFGGFILPFLPVKYKFDFSLPGITSIAVDPHKMGLSTIPSGVLLFRDFEYINHLRVHAPYLTVDTQYTLTGTRSGGAVAATYAVMMFLGKKGYTEVVNKCMELTRYLVKKVQSIGIQPAIDPVMNVVTLYVPHPTSLRTRLCREYDWHVSITQNPKALRIVIMPHLDFDIIDMFVDDLEKALKA
ncbi:tyrosine decarboxylase MfnA [Methanolobus halotolerans]|uniref:Probable L-tyrosine/L-aspartate decarboxylase n=1 Tax=Methanolobus halotolerans TaxID=2052935 RepID=A0A4E0PWS0_9EURY|nr:tyrosine decarboxylase MfnA [Methanolobus halotolerans]TGC09007.1 tyrosine decarboxylase MfnA [Methanolobus halotolerans]